MAGVYGSSYPQRAAAGWTVTPWAASLLLVLAAVLAVSGSFATISVYRIETSGSAPDVQASSAWSTTSTQAAPGFTQATAPIGIAIVVAAVLAVVAALLLLRSTAVPADPARSRIVAGVAAGMLAGSVAVVWIEQLTLAHNAAANSAAIADRVGPDSGFRTALELGAGAYLLLVAALLGLAAAVILLLGAPGRPGVVPGPGYPAPAPYPGGPVPYPPPGPPFPPGY